MSPSRTIVRSCVASLLLAGSALAEPMVVASLSTRPVSGHGSVTFTAATSIRALTIHGESTAVQGSAVVEREGEQLRLRSVSATIPVATFKTGMELRDRHMRERIFQTTDGQMPDVAFRAVGATCAPGSGCVVDGELTLRGATRPVAVSMTISPEDSRYRATGEMIVKLSAFGIEIPRQFGVSMQDEVRVQLELSGDVQ